MELHGSEMCTINGQGFSEGYEICDSKVCYRCDHGDWSLRTIDLLFGVGP